MTTGTTTPAFGGLRATWRVRLRAEKMDGWFDLDRAVAWSGECYAARNPHWCEQSQCDCGWIVWPAEFPLNWCCVGLADIEFIEEVTEA